MLQKDKTEDPVPISALKEILGKKCNYLQIGGTVNKLSLIQVEEMIQVLHCFQNDEKKSNHFVFLLVFSSRW